jgi:hypothetical protein
MDIELIFNILLVASVVISILLAWYFTSKYILATGIGSRYDETMPIFIGGIVLFSIIAVIIYIVMRTLYA